MIHDMKNNNNNKKITNFTVGDAIEISLYLEPRLSIWD